MVHVRLSQELLLRSLRERIARARGEAATEDNTTFERADGAAGDWRSSDGVAAVVVLRDFAPSAFADSCLRFACSLGQTEREQWQRHFTRTIFLAGNPRNLKRRFAFDWVANDGSIGWISPAPPDATMGLRRLLCLFRISNPLADISDFDLSIPGPKSAAAARTIYVAIGGIEAAEYLVHLNHILAEGVLAGDIGPGDRLRIRHVPTLSGHEADFVSLRVHVARLDPRRLRAYAGLTKPDSGNAQASPSLSREVYANEDRSEPCART